MGMIGRVQSVESMANRSKENVWDEGKEPGGAALITSSGT